MQQLLSQLWDAVQPSITTAVKAAVVVLVPAITAYLRAWFQRKIADAAVARAEGTGLQGPAKKAVAMGMIAKAHPLVRPLSTARAGAAIEKAHVRMHESMRPTVPETPSSKG